MTLREEITQMSETRMATMPKLVSNRFGGLENRAQIVKFIESVLSSNIANRPKLASDIFDGIYQEGYDNGHLDAAMDAAGEDL